MPWLLAEAARRVGAAQRELAHAMKLELSAAGHPLASRLDYADDTPFLEPALFAYFSDPAPCLTLDQLLYAALPAEARPATLEAYADADGIVELPGWGRLSSGLRGCRGVIAPVQLASAPVRRIEATAVELCTHVSPLFQRLLRDARDLAEGNALDRDHAAALERAWRILARVAPLLHECLLAVTRRIVILGPGLRSFAALSAHGAAFVRPCRGADEVFFIEDLAHQCGHMLFNALTLDREGLLAIAPETPLGAISGERAERRSIYVTLHGMFTECLIEIALGECLRMAIFEGRQRHELLGRLAFSMKRLELDLRALREHRIFTRRGRRLMLAFEEVFEHVTCEAGARLCGFDLSNQGYTFNYTHFTERNAMVVEPGVAS